MTNLLRILLLGKVSIQRGEAPLCGLPSRAAEALLIYLACNPGPISREKLAEMLWADRSQTQAMTNLRTILTPLRRELGDYLLVNRQTLALNPQKDFWLDATEFEQKLTALDLTSSRAASAGLREQLAAVLALYQGDFLEGFYLRDGRGFEEWAALQRERLRRLAREGFRLLAYAQLETGAYPAGIQTAARWQHLDPYDEDAARTYMWLLARTGQRNAALQVYRELAEKLEQDISVAPAAATRQLYQRLQNLEFPPPHNLPANVTPFVGRGVEIGRLEAHLLAATPRLVSIVGPGGIGKTRLSVEVARWLWQHKAGRFFDGTFFVPLGMVDSAEALPTRLAEVLGVSLSGVESPQKELINHLRKREILLILDNLEHLIDRQGRGLAFLVEILNQAPQVKLLVTSQQRLNLYEELVFDLPGLDVPQAEAAHPEDASAVALFVQRADRVRAGFVPQPGELNCIAQACRLLQGSPLAIELAASWARHTTCEEIVAQIETNLDFLQAPYHNIPKRHRSLRAVFEHSWNLLSPDEQSVFAACAVFQDGFTCQAAAALPQAPDELDILGLVEKSLVEELPQQRFDIHPLLRAYAVEKLAAQPVANFQAGQSHSRYFIEFLETQQSGAGPEQRAAIREELSNIQAAWAWAARQRDWALLERAAPVLHNFYSVQSWFREGLEQFELALTELQKETELAPQQAALICDLLGRKARLDIHIGQLEQARLHLQAALQGLGAVENPVRRSTVLSYLAITHFYAGDYAQAAALADQARQLSLQIGDADGIAFAWNFMGSCAKALGDYDQAQERFERSVEAYDALEDELGAAMVLNNLGNLAQAQGHYEIARQHYQACSQVFKAHDHLYGAATTLINAGKLAVRLGDCREARQLLEEGLAIKQQVGDQRGAAVALISLGDASLRVGEGQQAKAQLRQGLALALESGDVNLLLDGLAVAADWLLKTGRSVSAAELLAYIQKQAATSQETRQRVESSLSQSGAGMPAQTSPQFLNQDVEQLAKNILAAHLSATA